MIASWLLVVAAIIGCKEPSAEVKVRPVRAVKIGDAASVEGRWFPGRARATEEVNLSFRVGGELAELPIGVGDDVKRGDLLAKLDPVDYQATVDGAEAKLAQAIAELDAMRIARPEELRRLEAEVREAEAVLELAKSDYQRAESIQKNNPDAISESEVDRRLAARERSVAVLEQTKESLEIAREGARKEDVAAKEAEIKALEADFALARNNLKYTELIAPFNGTISAKYVENFQTIVSRQVVCRLLDNSKIEIVIDIPESRISLAPYMRDLVCVFDAFPQVEITGVAIKEVGTEASAITRTYPVTCIMDQPDSPDVKILPGMAGRVNGRAQLPDEAKQGGFLIPDTAVFTDADNQPTVWVIDESSMAVHAKNVSVVEPASTGMVVEGLSPGTLIATAGVDYLKEGQKVRLLSQGQEEVR
jgi:RND family efflux transporter MFP subunit